MKKTKKTFNQIANKFLKQVKIDFRKGFKEGVIGELFEAYELGFIHGKEYHRKQVNRYE